MVSHSIIHHVSVINRDIEKSFHFYHDLFGLDILLKTVNQDDLEMYHLFYSDKKGRLGTKFTVFQMKDGVDKTFGTNVIERTVFAFSSVNALYYWEKRLKERGILNCEIEEYDESKILRFEDFDGVQLGIASVHLRVRYAAATSKIMQQLFGLEVIQTSYQGSLPITILSGENTLLGQEIHIIEDRKSKKEIMGIGGTHHVALAVKDTAELSEIEHQVKERNFENSGVRYREFFTSLYFREPNQLLFEVATEEGFVKKEESTTDGFDTTPLYLPDFFRKQKRIYSTKIR